MAKLVVLDGYTINPGDNPWDPLAALGDLQVFERSEPDEIVSRARGADVVLTNKTPLDRDTLAALDGLRGISVLATGVNVVDLAAARARGIVVCNVPSYSTASVAQHAIALLLELCSRVGLHDASVRAGDWSRSPDFSYTRSPLIELSGKRLGLVGYGEIGQRVAALARALGMEVVAARSAQGHEGVEPPRWELERLFRECDVISLHCPLTPATAGLVSRERLQAMKPTALLINTARGGLVDEQALAHALSSGEIAGAALDVLSSEPPPADHPLLGLERCVITPHIAWTSLEARRRLLAISVENVRGILSANPVHVVR